MLACVCAHSLQGLIPAGAGNILILVHLLTLVRAHPRGCGEHGVRMVKVLFNQGSSPRVRGTWRVLHKERGGYGLIPAGAGNILITLCCRA